MTDLPLNYMKSNGDLIPIADMAFPYLRNAIGVLERGADPKRQPELDAMRERMKVLNAEYRATIAAERADPMTAPERVSEIDEILKRMDGGS